MNKILVILVFLNLGISVIVFCKKRKLENENAQLYTELQNLYFALTGTELKINL